MDKIAVEAAPKLVEYYGPIGIFVLLLVAAIVVLWFALRSAQKDLAALNKQFGELAERAVKGLESSRGTIENATRAIEEQGEANDARQAAMIALTAAQVFLKETIDRVLNRVERTA